MVVFYLKICPLALQISAADIAAFTVFEGVIAKYGEDVFKMAPKLMDNRKKVMSNPRIGNYLKNRKHTDM